MSPAGSGMPGAPGLRTILTVAGILLALLLLFLCAIVGPQMLAGAGNRTPTTVAQQPTADTPQPVSTPEPVQIAAQPTADIPQPTPTPRPTSAPAPTLAPTRAAVITREPPVLTLPGNLTVEANSPAGASVTFQATSRDPVDGALAVTCQPASGATFPIGLTKVACSASNRAGISTKGSFDLTVQHTLPPAIGVPGDMTVEATGPKGAAATYTVSVADSVDKAPPATCDHPSGSTFPLGDTTVTCTATDEHKNKSTASFKMKVVDTTPPRLTVPADMTVEATGPNGAAASFSPSAEDSVDKATVTCVPASGSTFRLGNTTVTCTATDGHKNKSSASFKVSVVHTLKPPTVPPDITREATAPSGTVITYTVSISDPIVPSATVTCAPASNSIFPIGTTTVNCTGSGVGGSHSSASFKVNVTHTPFVGVLYDFVKNGSAATWTNGGGTVLSFPAPGADNLGDELGFVHPWHGDKAMEDGSRPAQALETHPQWIDNGLIQGYYPRSLVTIQSKDLLRLKVGFMQYGAAGDVTFHVSIMVQGICESDPPCLVPSEIAAISHAYNGQLVEQVFDLSRYAGYSGPFLLSVTTNGRSNQDWATWIVAQIERTW